jgi:chemotaxis protein CheD
VEQFVEEKNKYFLQPGYIFVSKDPYFIHTVLGSCISVCIWDSKLKIGGMNHYIYARPFEKERNAKFGSISVPHLINLMIDMGASKINLKSHIIGGSQSTMMTNSSVGRENIKVAEDILRKNYIDIVTMDIGGEMGRKVIFDNKTGEVVVYKVNKIREKDWHAY